jgi:hypothetical protein
MSKPATILTAIETALKADVDLYAFIGDRVFIGTRSNIVDYPCIIIERTGQIESDDTYPTQKITMTVALMCCLRSFNKDTPLVGSATETGTMEFENMVKKAIDADRYLSGSAVWVRITNTVDSTDLFPVRVFTLEIEVDYRQTAGTRT